MNKREILNKVSEGLRRMRFEPDFFIFIQQEDWTWDEETILGFPVYHCSTNKVHFAPYGDEECPFIPCNFKEKVADSTYDFARGYTEG